MRRHGGRLRHSRAGGRPGPPASCAPRSTPRTSRGSAAGCHISSGRRWTAASTRSRPDTGSPMCPPPSTTRRLSTKRTRRSSSTRPWSTRRGTQRHPWAADAARLRLAVDAAAGGRRLQRSTRRVMRATTSRRSRTTLPWPGLRVARSSRRASVSGASMFAECPIGASSSRPRTRPGIRASAIFSPASLEFLASRGDVQIPGPFTAGGWEKIRDVLHSPAPLARRRRPSSDGCSTTRACPPDDASLRSQVLQAYFDEYTRRWMSFLDELKVKTPTDAPTRHRRAFGVQGGGRLLQDAVRHLQTQRRPRRGEPRPPRHARCRQPSQPHSLVQVRVRRGSREGRRTVARRDQLPPAPGFRRGRRAGGRAARLGRGAPDRQVPGDPRQAEGRARGAAGPDAAWAERPDAVQRGQHGRRRARSTASRSPRAAAFGAC